jgi:hypothetical protein
LDKEKGKRKRGAGIMTEPITTLHYAAGNADTPEAIAATSAMGFNLFDLSSADQLDSLPAGAKALIWVDGTLGATSSFRNLGRVDGFDPDECASESNE